MTKLIMFIFSCVLLLSLPQGFASNLPTGTTIVKPALTPYARSIVSIQDQTDLHGLAEASAGEFLIRFMWKKFDFAKKDHLQLTAQPTCQQRVAGPVFAVYGFEEYLCSAELSSDFSQFSANFEIMISATAAEYRQQARLGTTLPGEVLIELVNDDSNDCDAQLRIVNSENNVELISRTCEDGSEH